MVTGHSLEQVGVTGLPLATQSIMDIVHNYKSALLTQESHWNRASKYI